MLVRLVLVGLLVSSLALLADWSIEYGSMHEAFKRHLTAASPTAPVPDCVANLFTGVTPSDYEVVLAREGRSYNAGHKFKKKMKIDLFTPPPKVVRSRKCFHRGSFFEMDLPVTLKNS